MPDSTPSSPESESADSRLESYWIRRFERSAQSGTDAARNIGHSFGHRERREVFQELLARHLPASARSVLDVGCGSGTYFDLYARHGLRLQGIDFSPAQLAVARAAWPDARLFAGELSAAPADVSADLVVCIGVVQTITDLPAFIGGLAARLAPGGIAIVSCLEKRSIWPGALLDPHLRFYSRAHLRRLLADAGLVERDHRRFYPLPPPANLLRPLLYRWQVPWLNHGLMFVLESRARE